MGIDLDATTGAPFDLGEVGEGRVKWFETERRNDPVGGDGELGPGTEPERLPSLGINGAGLGANRANSRDRSGGVAEDRNWSSAKQEFGSLFNCTTEFLGATGH